MPSAAVVPNPAIVDFESYKIESRPAYPPKPVGVAIQSPREGRKKPVRLYDAWGHATGNNCTREKAVADLKRVWDDPKLPLLFHNSKFDYDVATTGLGLKPLPWQRVHDTLYLLFFNDPHQRSLSLKPSAERLLGMPPEERDDVENWLKANKPKLRKAGEGWGAYISEAPGDIVAPYAMGDVERTGKLFEYLYKDIEKRGMLGAYDRERELMPIMLENERAGIRVDLAALEADIPVYEAAGLKTDKWIRSRLGVAKDFNIDSDDQLGAALERNGVIPDEAWVYTPTGQRSIAKKNLPLSVYKDKKLASALGYRNRLSTCLNMFMLKWRDVARTTKGNVIHCQWNQVRQAKGMSNSAGARTGRFSSEDPNLQNLSKNFEEKSDGYTHPKFLNVPPLPLVRRYILPDSASALFLHRDYSQQELRLLAEYEDGPLLAAYVANPKLDVHGIVHDAIKRIVGKDFVRGKVKNYVFQKIYGGGIPAICAALGCDAETAKKVIAATMEALPGYKDLEDAIKERARDRSVYPNGFPIVTWGGRVYHAEPPAFSKKFNYKMSFEYKLLNYLIQGSAGDMTKEAIIRYHNHPKREGRFLLTVHDEINVSSPPARSERARRDAARREMEVLRESMEGIPGFAVPILSEGATGPNWGTLTKEAA